MLLTCFLTAETAEGLNFASALTLYSRNRFVAKLLPLLQNATGLRRVVSVFVGTKEGAVDVTNIQAIGMGMMAARAHNASLTTLSLEKFSKDYPEVSFIHAFPGMVNTGIWRGTSGILASMMKGLLAFAGSLMTTSIEETGERHFYLSTSENYPAAKSTNTLVETVAVGTDGKIGSGVYSVDNVGESASSNVQNILARLRKEGVAEKLWSNVEEEIQRIVD